MKKTAITRRKFIGASALAGAGVSAGLQKIIAAEQFPSLTSERESLALLGGKPVRAVPERKWPVYDEREEKALLDVLRSGHWFRGSGKQVQTFERTWAERTGAKYCVATNSGTSALFTSLEAAGVCAGDEVIVAPYTFIATVNVILLHHALPVFVDTDPETLQIDASKIEAAITDRTRAIIPVHLGGSPANLDRIMDIASRHKIPVIEDACQAHLGEWRNKKLGTLGATGCFSFQASKNLNCGDGGAILTDSEELADKCYSFHNNCRTRQTSSNDFTYRSSRGGNLRMTEFQGAILLTQITRLDEQMKTREQNVGYLRKLLQDVPGILPARMYEGCTRNGYHLFMFRYLSEAFAGLPRDKFIKALAAEGVKGLNPGYGMLNKENFIKQTLASRSYQRLFPASVLSNWEERTRCPENDKVSTQAAWFTQTTLLGSRSDMETTVGAIRKVQKHAAALAKA